MEFGGWRSLRKLRPMGRETHALMPEARNRKVVMPAKVVRRSIKVRHSARPQRARAAGSGGGFFAMLAKLNDASARLNRARPRSR